MILPDVQAYHPDVEISLTRVGITGVKKIVEIARDKDRPIILVSSFDVFVDLPEDIKGANLSRNSETVDEVLEDVVSSPIYRVEDVCCEVTKRLLDRHKYASHAEVKMKSEYMMVKRTPVTNMRCQDEIAIFAKAKAIRDGNIRKCIGAEIIGMTVCPCTQEMIREKAIEELRGMNLEQDKIDRFMQRIPMATHNQRGRGYLSINFDNRFDVPLEKIIDIIQTSMSAETFGLLKRADEEWLVEKAHKNPVFVEDCVRAMASKVVDEFGYLSDDSIVTIRQINEESIHKHDAFAEMIATIGELRTKIGVK
jgi:GTP cyclohydrolase-4